MADDRARSSEDPKSPEAETVASPARRELLGTFVPLDREPAPPPKPRRRPPGAVAEEAFLAGCTGCMDCVEACPMNAIYTLAPHVTPGAGTPVMVPDERACTMCTGWPCAAACPEDVLEVPKGRLWRLGTVQVHRDTCLPFLGPECGACVRLCPPGAEEAIYLRYGKPRVDMAKCVGCGLCIRECPTSPRSLSLIPLSRGGVQRSAHKGRGP